MKQSYKGTRTRSKIPFKQVIKFAYERSLYAFYFCFFKLALFGLSQHTPNQFVNHCSRLNMFRSLIAKANVKQLKRAFHNTSNVLAYELKNIRMPPNPPHRRNPLFVNLSLGLLGAGLFFVIFILEEDGGWDSSESEDQKKLKEVIANQEEATKK